jgi:hypothetical protein
VKANACGAQPSSPAKAAAVAASDPSASGRTAALRRPRGAEGERVGGPPRLGRRSIEGPLAVLGGDSGTSAGALVLVGASPKADGILFTLAPVVLPVRDGGKRTQPVG